MHYSGCTADCGQAMTTDIGLQGMRARKDGEMVEALDIGVGDIGENPSFIEWVRQRVPADEVPGLIRNLVVAYAALREESDARSGHRNGDGGAVGGQTFREWVDATGHETLVELAEPEGVAGYEDPCLADGKQVWCPFSDEPEGTEPVAEADD